MFMIYDDHSACRAGHGNVHIPDAVNAAWAPLMDVMSSKNVVGEPNQKSTGKKNGK